MNHLRAGKKTEKTKHVSCFLNCITQSRHSTLKKLPFLLAWDYNVQQETFVACCSPNSYADTDGSFSTIGFESGS